MSNISLPDPNFVYYDNYFYTIDDALQLLIKKTFDGEVSFCYTLNVQVAARVESLDFDGIFFWSLERGTARVIIRKWKIVDLMCVQMAKFEIIGNASQTIDGYAFAVEHYTTELSGDEPAGQTVLSIDDVSNMLPDMHIFIGPNGSGQTEEKVIDTVGTLTVTVKTPLTYNYSSGDIVKFYKSGYYFNDYDGIDGSSGSLYEINLETGSTKSLNASTQFKGVKSATFGKVRDKNGDAVYDFNGDGVVNSSDVVSCLMFISGPLMCFSDVSLPTNPVYGTMMLDIISGQTVETVYDVTLGRDTSASPNPNENGSTIYLLKSGYDYEVSQFDIMVNSISVTSAPAILPADGLSTSKIRATVSNQYGQPIANKDVEFALVGDGSLPVTVATTNQYGIAEVTYVAGLVVGDATITATVSQS